MPTPATALKIMPLGDSITQGTVPGGYRAPLYWLLTANGYTISYVGDQDTNAGGGLPANEQNHEGIAGDTSVAVKSEIDGSGIVQTSLPNIVLLLIGTNDVGLGASNTTADADVAALIDDVIAKDPTVHILMSNVLHRADDGTGWVDAFNATLPAIVAARAANVTLVDMASALTLADLDSGGIHPLQSGYNKMAVVWNTAINAYTGAPQQDVIVRDTSTNQPLSAAPQAYSGPVAGLVAQYVNTTTDSLDISVVSPGWFIHSGSGTDAIAVTSGNNVVDGGLGSNYLTGGSGNDTFYLDDRAPPATIWSTIVNFHAGDNATVWGITAVDFKLNWLADKGAVNATGLTGVFTPSIAGPPETAITLTGYTPQDLTNGKLSISYGKTTDLPGLPGSNFMLIHAN